MSSSYSPDLRFELPANGEQSGVWGNTTNNNIGTLIEQAIAGTSTVSITSANQALTVYNGVADQSRNAIIKLTTTTVAPFNVFVPPVSKLYVFVNTTNYAATAYASSIAGNTTAAGSGVSLAANSTSFVYCDGTNVVDAMNHISGNLYVEGALTLGDSASVANNLSVTGSAALGLSQTATITTASPGVVTVSNAPINGTTVSFTTTGTLPTGITAGALYYVVNRTSTTFQVSSTYGGSGINTSGSQSGVHTVSAAPTAVTAASGSNSNQLATTAFVANAVGAAGVTYQTLAAVVAATTANITLAAPQTIDGISVVAGDRVLVKNQTAAADNGVYVVNAGAWTRATDANTSTELAAALVPVIKGAANGGLTFTTKFKSTDTLGSTAMSWNALITGDAPTIDSPVITNGSMSTVNIYTPVITNATMLDMSSSVITQGTAVSASGTSFSFPVPTWAKRITVMFDSLSTNATAYIQVQLGTGGIAQTTGYGSCTFQYNSASSASSTTGFIISEGNTAANVRNGHIIICKLSDTIWTSTGIVLGAASSGVNPSAGHVTMTGDVDLVRITTIAGTATFDSGTVNILYE